jgi:hypothetical protein
MLTAKQIQEWFEFYNLEPFGSAYEDKQHAYTRHIMALSGGLKKKNSNQSFDIVDFCLLRQEETEHKKQSVEEMKEIMLAVAGVMNKK